MDGPPVTTPDQEGFGLFLIRGEIEYRLAGQVEVDFAPGGLGVTLSFPLKP